MKNRLQLIFILIFFFSFLWSTAETTLFSIFVGKSRVAHTSMCSFLNKIAQITNIGLNSISSIYIYHDIREIKNFIIFWSQMNIGCIFIVINVAMLIIIILWFLSKLRKQNLLLKDNIVLILVWALPLLIITKINLISNISFINLNGAVTIFLLILSVVSFTNLIKYKIIILPTIWMLILLLIYKFGFINIYCVPIFFILICITARYAKHIKVITRLICSMHKYVLMIIGLAFLVSVIITTVVNIRDRTLKQNLISADMPYNIILISIDTFRSDHLGCYGYKKNTTPNIDKLANDGVLFLNNISTTSWTIPAHISLLTSLAPEVHNMTSTRCYNDPKQESFTICAKVLKKAGYITAGFVSGAPLISEFGYNQGFDIYDDYTTIFPLNFNDTHTITSPKIHERVSKWLQNNHNASFFLFIHYWDLHASYIPPEPYHSMFDPDYNGNFPGEIPPEKNDPMFKRNLEHTIAMYDGEIAFADYYIGKLMACLKKLDIYNKTLIILTSDHGEEFYEHGNTEHGFNLYDETLKVPLIIKFPFNKWHGERIENQVQIIDIIPTFFSYLSLNWYINSQGKNLMPLITGELQKYEGDGINYADLNLWGESKCVRTNAAKYIWNVNQNSAELYDLQKDKFERNNIIESNQALAKSLRELLTKWTEKTATQQTYRKNESIQNDEVLNRLRDLGYI